MKTSLHHYQNETSFYSWVEEEELHTSSNILIQVFYGTADLEHFQNLGTIIKSALPFATLIMTTTDGEILNNFISKNSIIISATIFLRTHVSSTIVQSHTSCVDMGKSLAKQAPAGSKLAIVFLSGNEVNAEMFLKGFKKHIPHGCILAGGLAGSCSSSNFTLVGNGDKSFSNGAVAAFLVGDFLKVYNHHNLSWKPVGFKLTVTKAKQNRLYEIDGIRALDIYSKYLGYEVTNNLSRIGIQFPLLVKRDQLCVPRACLKIYEDGSLGFGGNFKEGESIYFGIGTPEKLSMDAINTLKTLCEYGENVFTYPCMALRRLYSSHIHNILSLIPENAPLSGGFLNGEFFTINQQYHFFNESFTAISLTETQESIQIHISEHNLIKDNSDEATFLLSAMSRMLKTMTKEWQNKLHLEITKNNEQQELLLQQSKMAQMGDMVAMIAHQWRQPLNAISATAIDLTLKTELEQLREYDAMNAYRFIQDQCQKMSKTIDLFLNFSRTEAKISRFNPIEAIEDTLLIIEKQLSNHGILLVRQYPEISPYIIGDKNQFEQVMINLLTNARDAFDQSIFASKILEISVHLNDDETFCSIAVCDNAGGIEAEVQKKLFSPYYTTKSEGNGTGLGLFMSKKIIEETFNGDIVHYPVDRGSKFIITIRNINEE